MAMPAAYGALRGFGEGPDCMASAARVTMPDEGVETLYGPYDENLKQLEIALTVRLRTSGSDVAGSQVSSVPSYRTI